MEKSEILSMETLRIEIGKNIEDIQENLESVGLKYKITSFAYPYGDYDERVQKLLQEYGVIHGLSYSNEINFEPQISMKNANCRIPDDDGIICSLSQFRLGKAPWRSEL